MCRGVSLDSFLKYITEMEIDHFAKLPDDLLVEIISLVDMHTASRTVHLSKRWERVWAEMKTLKFDSLLWWDEKEEFVSWINRVVAISKVDTLEKLEIEFWFPKKYISDVDGWIEFCVKKKVKQLILRLGRWRRSDGSCDRSDVIYDRYTLPEVMYSLSSLTTLYLEGCMMPPYKLGKIKWDSLIDLNLEAVELNNHLLDEILSTCSVLKSLSLIACRGFNRLDVDSPSLQYLTVNTFIDLKILSAPRDLHICLILGAKISKIPDVVNIGLCFRVGSYDVSWTEVAEEFFESFKHVVDFHLHARCFRVLSSMMWKGMKLTQFKDLQHLTLHCDCSLHCTIPGIIELLKSSPKLQTLSLYAYETETDNSDSHRDDLDDLDGDLLHLRKITINDFGGEPLLMLALILLRRAPDLEEMVINISETSEFTKISDTLSTCHKSSSKATIELSRK